MKKLFVLLIFGGLIWACEVSESNIELKTEENYGIDNKVILANIEDGIHTPSGLKAGAGLESVLRSCISCHSSKLITQNRATEEGWKSMIHWMYETQNLPQLGEQEEVIIAYLGKNYAPVDSGRRKSLEVSEWYELEEND